MVAVAEEEEWVAVAAVAVAKRNLVSLGSATACGSLDDKDVRIRDFSETIRCYTTVNGGISSVRYAPSVDRLDRVWWEDQGQPEIMSGGDETTKRRWVRLTRIEEHVQIFT